MPNTSRKLGDVNIECTIKAQRSCPHWRESGATDVVGTFFDRIFKAEFGIRKKED